MRPKISSKRALFLAVPSGLILFTPFLFHFIPTNSNHDQSASLTENIAVLSNQENEYQDQEEVGLPARIKIPVIDVDTDIIPVGLTSDGAMDVPKGPNEVAWYDRSFRPGEDGTAVATGHYGWKNNVPAIFDNLHQLKRGDKIMVEDENGKISVFIVRETRIYGKDAIAPEVFGSNDGKGHLNLITCIGDWNKSEQSFSERLIVFTDKE